MSARVCVCLHERQKWYTLKSKLQTYVDAAYRAYLYTSEAVLCAVRVFGALCCAVCVCIYIYICCPYLSRCKYRKVNKAQEDDRRERGRWSTEAGRVYVLRLILIVILMVADASVLPLMWLMLRNYSVMQIDYTPENFLLAFSCSVPFRPLCACEQRESVLYLYRCVWRLNRCVFSRIISVHQICFV